MATSRLATLSQAISGTANGVRRIAHRLDRGDLEQRLLGEATRWTDTSCVISVLGPPGVGRTSLVRALSGAALPAAAALASSSVISILRHADSTTISVSDANGMREVDAMRLASLVTSGDQVPELVEVRCPAPRLIDSVALVDTPGVNGLDDLSTRRALATTTTSDALLYLLDATRPISAPELALLTTAASRTRSICVLITKIDRHRGWREMVAAAKRACSDVAELADARVIGVSSSLFEAAFEPDMDDAESAELLEESGCSEVQAFLDHVARRVRHVRLHNFAATITAVIGDLEQQQREVVALAGDDRADATIAHVEQARRALGDLRDDGASWLLALGDQVGRTRDELTSDLGRRMHDYARRCDERIHGWRGGSDEFIAQVDADLALVAGEFGIRISERVEEIVEMLGNRIEFDGLHMPIDVPALVDAAAALPDPVAPAGADNVRLRVTGSLVSVATSSSMLLTMAGGDAGVANLVRIGALGAATVFSGALVAITVRNDRHHRDEAQLRAELKARIDLIRADAPLRIRQHLVEVQRSLEQQVRRQLRDRNTVLEARVTSLQAMSRTAQVERRRAAQRAEDDLRQLGEHRAELGRLATDFER